MIATRSRSQADFYKEWLMARRNSMEPRDYGLDMDRQEFLEKLTDLQNETYRGQLSIDELCLRPTEALRFISDARRMFAAYDLPEDFILRTLMNNRKKGQG
jgi:hypothetical protein